MAAILLRIRTWWETADRTQKVVTIMGSLLLVTILGVTLLVASRPKMDILFRDLSPADQASVVDELTKIGIPVEYDRSGLVSVPSNKIAEAQAKLVTAGKLPSSGNLGYEELGKMGVMISPEVEKDRRTHVKEGMIASAIEQIQGVQKATVNISLGEKSPFIQSETNSSAVVTISESASNPITGEAAQAVKNLILRSVERLDPKNISIITNTGRTLFDGSSEANGQGLASARLLAERSEAKRREQSLQSRLDAILGPGNAIVSVPVLELNFDEKSEERTEKTPTETPVSEDSMGETMSTSDPLATGIAGATPNTPDTSNPTGSKTQGYSNNTKSKQYDVNTKHTVTKKATGTLTRLAYNVVVNSTKVTDLVPVTQTVKSELGPLAADPANFSAVVTGMPFDTTLKDNMAKTTAANASAESKQQMLSMLPVVALLLVGFMVVRAIAKTSKSQNVLVAAMPGGQMMQVGVSNDQYTEVDSDVAAMVAANPQATEAELQAAGVSSSQQGSQTVVVGGNGTELLFESADPAQLVVHGIPDKLHVPLEQLRKFSMEKPEKVALLLKSWLLEDK